MSGLLCVEVDGLLHFNFTTTVEDVVIRSSGLLEGDKVRGSSRIEGVAGVDQLYVWSGVRATED